MGRAKKIGPREPNGRLKRERVLTDREMADNQSVAIAARIRVLGVSPKDAKDQKAATLHGRLCLIGQEGGGISIDHYHTAERYLSDRNAYLRAIGAKVEYQEPAGLTDADEGAYERFCERAKARMKWYNDLILDAMQEARFKGEHLDAADAIYQILVLQKPAYTMVGDLRTILNAIERADGGEKRRAA